ncbi:hypothetical protein [Candidatus Tisiphia endosymbiont of Nemotelus uliginosus]|uniref:hypothetical protein n=1 Tax=Candidatus Tisiphia endosymbiont of Nemotelus uliginosus TaxID=3077926 RepID=UPI0035C89054
MNDNYQDIVPKGYVADLRTRYPTLRHEKLMGKLQEKLVKQMHLNRCEGVLELLAAPAYEILISNSAPKEQLVISDDNNKESLYVRSKFFDNAETLDQFTGADNTQLNYNSKKLQEVQGFEHIKAACDFFGESDYHAGNLMVQNGRTLTKIDHGKSFSNSSKDFDSFITLTDTLFKLFGYQQAINEGNLVFNIKKYSEALNNMSNSLTEDRSNLNNRSNLKKDTIFDIAVADYKNLPSEEQKRLTGVNNTIDLINNTIDSNVKALQDNGVDPKGLSSSFEALGSHYKKWLQNNVDSMKEVAKDVEVIAKFSLGPKVDAKFQNGQWVEKMAKAKFCNPVLFASINDIKIEGKNALIWATENDYRVKRFDRTQYVNVPKRLWHKENGKWSDVNTTAIQQKVAFIESDPVERLLFFNSQSDPSVRVPLSNSASEFLQYALKNKLVSKMTGESYADMMLRNNLSPKDYYKPPPPPRSTQEVDIELQKKAKQIGQEALKKRELKFKGQKSTTGSKLLKVLGIKNKGRGWN